MRVATDIASWAVEARKHNMTYGQYVQAVNHGELPPPKAVRKAQPKIKQVRTRICKRCGAEFEVRRRPSDGCFSEAKYCEPCRVIAKCYHRKVVR